MSNPLVAQAQDSTTWSTGLGLVEDAHLITNGIQDQSWVDGSGQSGGPLPGRGSCRSGATAFV